MPSVSRESRRPAPERPWRAPLRHGWTPAGPARRPVLFVNPNSGGGKAARAGLAERARGIEAVVLESGADLGALAAEQVDLGADGLGVAGGDGSLAVVRGGGAGSRTSVRACPRRNSEPLRARPRRRSPRSRWRRSTRSPRRSSAESMSPTSTAGCSSTTCRSGSTATRCSDRSIGTRSSGRCSTIARGSRPLRRRTGVADGGRPRTASTVTRRWSSSPTTPTRSAAGRDRHSDHALERAARGSPPRSAERGPRRPGRSWTATAVSIEAADRVRAGVDGEAVDLQSLLRVVTQPEALRVRISARHRGVSLRHAPAVIALTPAGRE